MANELVAGATTITWQELLNTCSRLHTTRRRQEPWKAGEWREDPQMLNIWLPRAALVAVPSLEAVVVPTRMHEPGFYVRTDDPRHDWVWRSVRDLEMFRRFVDAGQVATRDPIFDVR